MATPTYPPFLRKLPLNPADGEQIADLFGNIFVYDASVKMWSERGVLRTFGVVNDTVDGLVSPEIYARLVTVRQLISQGVSFDAFKIRVGTASPYYYYLHSSDRLIKFTVERYDDANEVGLRIEVDKARLYHNIMSRCCQGPRGAQGAKGDPGEDGDPAPNEAFHKPLVTAPDTLTLAVPVNTPIGTAISVRLFRTQESANFSVEAEAPLDGSAARISVVDDSVKVDPTSTARYAAGMVTGAIKFASGIGNAAGWRYKARQKGPQGRPGKDGTRFLEVVTSFFDDASIRATSCVISMRKSPATDDMFLVKCPLPKDVCVGALSPSSDSLPTGPITETAMVAVRPTTRSCKEICAFKFIRPESEAPSLELPSWTPMACCVDNAHYDRFSFDWMSVANPTVPFTIMTDPEPPCQVCQSQFFFCPNLGDGGGNSQKPCNMQGIPGPPPRIGAIPHVPENGYSSGQAHSGSPPEVCP